MTYFLVGKVGADTLYPPGTATIIRRRRNLLGKLQWSYLYVFDPGQPEKIFWGDWQDWDMVKAGKYPASREVSEALALYLIDEYRKKAGLKLMPMNSLE